MKNTKLFNSLIATFTLAGMFTAGLPDAAFSNTSESDNENAAGIIVTIEDPEVQTSQDDSTSEYYVVDFDDLESGTDGFEKTNNGTTYTYGSNLEVKSANQWGGAGGSKFITQEKISAIRSYTIEIDKDQKYFGFWWSAGDPYNKITFKNDGEEVASFRTEDLVDFINSSDVSNTSEYYGNPAYNGSQTGHTNEPFSFVNIFFELGAYDEIEVATLTAGGSAFESDNHTFSATKRNIRGRVLPGATTPAGVDDTITTDEDTSVTANIMDNDVNPGNLLSIEKITIDGTDYETGTEITLSSGALLTVESDGQTTYNPNGLVLKPSDLVEDSFIYTVVNGYGFSGTADVTLRIDGLADAPVAVDDSRTTDEDNTKWIPVLKNDTDPDYTNDSEAREQLTIIAINNTSVVANQKVELPSGATVQLKNVNPDNWGMRGQHALKYDPTNSLSLQYLNDGENQVETFEYTVEDADGQTSTGMVTVTVNGITDTYAD